MVSLEHSHTCTVPFETGPASCPLFQHQPEDPAWRRCVRMIAKSPAMSALLERAGPIAATNAPVVILGETGSGKEILARALHANSPRKSKPFLAVNVAALPGELLESELFGHVKGAFTGAATHKQGLFEAADGGTLLLDEISEMPLALQPKLLRVIENGEVRRVGDVRPFFADVRILCATHQDLAACVEQRRFREDLYYRLLVFTLSVPALRQRTQDILPLARLFLAQLEHPTGRFTRAAQRALETYSWPGNVRQLANVVMHGSVLSGQMDVDVAHLPPEVTNREASPTRGRSLNTLAAAERAHVLRVLETCGGSRAEAARILGIGRTTLWRKLRGAGTQP